MKSWNFFYFHLLQYSKDLLWGSTPLRILPDDTPWGSTLKGLSSGGSTLKISPFGILFWESTLRMNLYDLFRGSTARDSLQRINFWDLFWVSFSQGANSEDLVSGTLLWGSTLRDSTSRIHSEDWGWWSTMGIYCQGFSSENLLWESVPGIRIYSEDPPLGIVVGF